jgi:hypothetical protein
MSDRNPMRIGAGSSYPVTELLSMEKKMPKTFFAVIGVLLVTASTTGIATGATYHTRKAALSPLSKRFLNSNNFSEGISMSARSASCQNREPGNPYNMQDDYIAWSAWRALGAWDSRNGCR